MTLLFHASEPVGHTYPGKDGGGIGALYTFLSTNSGTRVVLAHLGGGLPFYAHMPEVRQALEGVAFDTAACGYLYEPPAYAAVEPSRLLFGSDFPLITQTRARRELEAALAPELHDGGVRRERGALAGAADVTSQGERWRLFVAIELPETWLEALGIAQRALADVLETPSTPRLRWVRSEGIHLTLKFLGNLPVEWVDELRGLLSDAVPEPPGLTLSLGEPSFFTGPGGLVRVLWVGVRGDLLPLEALASNIDAACSKLDVPRERRRFAPHLTLARVPDGTSLSADDTRQALGRLETLKCPPLTVSRVSLMRSHLGPGGARYERIAAFPPEP